MKNAILLLVVLLCGSNPAFGQAGQKPTGQKPAPSTRKPAPPKPAPPAPAVKPVPPPPADVRFKSRYTTGDQITESVTYIRETRERYELGDMVLIRQHDLKQTVQVSVAALTYLITPEAAAATAHQRRAAEMPKPPGVVNIETNCRCRRPQAAVRATGAPRDHRRRSSTTARLVRSIKAADGNRRVAHRRAEGRRRAAAK